MRTWLIGIAVFAVAAALGVGAAYGGNAVLQTYRSENPEAIQTVPESDEWCGNEGMPAHLRRFERIRVKVQDRTESPQNFKSGNSNPEP